MSAEKTLYGHTGTVNALVCTNDFLISGSYDTTVRVWDLDNFQLKETLHGHTGGVYALEMAQGYLASASVDKSIRLWDLQSMSCSATLEGHTQSVHALTVWRDTLTSGSIDNSLMLWDMSGKTREIACDRESGLLDPERNDTRDNLWGIFSLCSINGYVCTGHRNGAVCVWNVESRECIRVLNSSYATRDRSEDARHLRLSQMCKYKGHLVTTNWDQCVRIWDPKTWREVKKLEGHEDNIDALCVIGDMIATGSRDGQIIVWGNDIEDMKIIHKFQGSGEGIRSLCNANGKLVSGSFQTIQIWDLSNEEEVAGAGSEMQEMQELTNMSAY